MAGGVTLGSLVLLSLETPLTGSSPSKSSFGAELFYTRSQWKSPWLLPAVS